MHSVILLLTASAVFELAVYIVHPRHRWLRTVLVLLGLAAIVFFSEAIVILNFSAAAVVIGYFSLFRLFNQLRIVKGRMHPAYLHRVSCRTSLWLIGAQFICALAWNFWRRMDFTLPPLIYASLVVVVISALMAYGAVRGHIRRMQQAAEAEAPSLKDWPSLTVAIPARNESESLHDCITSVLASQYPKLEVLVLDDSSQSRRTPEIIRSFAHDGVRFIHGDETRETWLPKNQAYDKLTQEASGEYILFLGVDIRLQAASLRRTVAYAVERHKSMVSIMPHNVLFDGRPMLIQPMRYFWEIGLPRRRVHRPPVLSSFWLVKKSALLEAGGMAAATRMIVPEAYFARRFGADGGYSFLASGSTYGVTSLKDRAEQRSTAVRVAYPSLHRRPEIVALMTIVCLIWAVLPALAIGLAVYETLPWMLGVALLCCMLWGFVYSGILRLAYGRVSILSLVSLPLAIINYACLLNFSMYKYEFSEVIWKGRNVSIPVMHVVPHLPQA